MAQYLLQELVTVREFREDRAGKAVSRARRELEEARAALVERKAELKEYIKWLVKEEDRLIQTIMLKKVKVGEITDLRLEIAELREREMDFHDAVKKAEGDVDKAEEALEEARLAHVKATQELEKLLEHRESWQQEQKQEDERQADLEMEEFTSGPAVLSMMEE